MSNFLSSMLGWRGRIGLTIPATNAVMEADFNRYSPEGVSIYASRMRRDNPVSSVQNNLEMLTYAESAAQLLVSAEVDFNVFGCTAGSFLKGAGSDIALGERLQKATGIPTVTAATALNCALKSLDVHKISLITPYIYDITVSAANFFKESGFQVVNYCGMGIERTANIDKVPPEGIYRFAKNQVPDDAQAVVISCTTFRGFEAVELLERDLGIPVATSNQACLWYAQNYLNIKNVSNGVGRLFNVSLKREE